MLPGAITLAMFVSAMIGGGMAYIDDKSRGVHEAYLVSPITKFELFLAMNIAVTLKESGCRRAIADGVGIADRGRRNDV
jgi:ABC-2 type transport system permease protein